jgi:protein-disulfide isomerase
LRDLTAVVRRVLDVTSIVIVLGALVVVGVQVLKRRLPPSTVENDGFSVSVQEFGELTTSGHWEGPRAAPAVILVYSDYTCGFCAELQTTLKALRHRYPQHVAVVLKHFVNPARLSHFQVPLAVECAADQDKFAEYHSAAFTHGRVLNYSVGWQMLADSAGVPDLDEFERCVLSSRHADRIQEQYEEAKRLGVTLTPTMFINGRVAVGAVPLPTLDSLVTAYFRGRGQS